MTAYTVLVCGTRTLSDVYPVHVILDGLRAQHENLRVVAGDAKGPDATAIEWATDAGAPHERFDADWNRFGRRAGPERNRRMLAQSKPDLVVAFWDGRSKGTADMIHVARKSGCLVWTIRIT